MENFLKVNADDVELALRFCRALDECPVRDKENCMFIIPEAAMPCSNCPILNFKKELMGAAQPFWAAWQQLLGKAALPLRTRNASVSHLFFGLGAVYSANKKRIPLISLNLIQAMDTKLQEDPVEYLRIITSDLKGLGSEWYQNFWERWQQLQLADNTVWIYNILLLKIFLEAIREEKMINRDTVNDIEDYLEKGKKEKESG